MIHKKYIIITVAIFLGICLLYYLFVVYPRQGKVAVDILTHPESATVTVNKNRGNTGTNYLPAGTYTFKAEQEGWEPEEITVAISEEVSQVALVLTPVSAAAKEQAKNDSLEREGLYGIAANTRGLDIRNTHPILNELPYSDTTGPFKIDFGFNRDDKKTPYLVVSYSTPNGRIEAIDWLRENKVDTTTTEIIFEDFRSPIYKETDTH